MTTVKKEPALTTEIAVWEDDPMSVPSAYTIQVPVPKLDTRPLAIKIVGNASHPGIYPVGTKEFRYWTAAASLERAVSYWRNLLPEATTWEVGPVLPVRLDAGEDLNAYYTRDDGQQGLSFFHEEVNGKTVYSGESSDIICHELGHAILDIIRPDLFDAASDEIAAFHESFADISAILSSLQIKSLREAVLAETGGDLHRSSRLSRLAEQLGWAIRQIDPDKADPDCLRNAVNSFVYQDPTTLPASGRNSMVSSDPHSFSRVFTGSFFDAFASMVALQSPTESNLLQVSQDAGKLLVEALQVASATSDFYSQVAAHMIGADKFHFKGKYSSVLADTFVKRRILARESASMIGPVSHSPAVTMRGIAAPEREAAAEFQQVALSTADYGLRSKTLLVSAPGQARRASRTFRLGMKASPSAEKVARSFVDYLFQSGKVDVDGFASSGVDVVHPSVGGKTHRLTQTPEGIKLSRVVFE